MNQITMDRCINCGIATNRCNTIGRNFLDDEATLFVIRKWRPSELINSTDHVCQACWALAQTPSGPVDEPKPRFGHKSTCLRCGRSLKNRVKHLLRTDSTREWRIYNVIHDWISPQNIDGASHICHACWISADRTANKAAVHMVPSNAANYEISLSVEIKQELPNEPTISSGVNVKNNPITSNRNIKNNQTIPSNEKSEIVLPNYFRPIETQSKCSIKGCQKLERNRVPLSVRKILLNQYNYYIPENNRLCNQHINIEATNFQNSFKNGCMHTFNAKHIQDMMTLK